jgi:hypothetical protein
MKNKSEPKTKQKRMGKSRKFEVESEKNVQEKLMVNSYKSQQSAFVKEKIKEILEDGQKKTFITLKPRQEIELTTNVLENRISVIRSVSSLFDEQKQIFNSSTPFQFNDEHSSSIM